MPHSATTKLVEALRGFLDTNQLPDPASVNLCLPERMLRIQPHVATYHDPVAVIGALLLWTRGLSGMTATWWRTTDDSLHISITGRLLSGVRVCVYQGVPYDTVREWVLLERDEHDSVSLDELAWLIGELHTARPAA